MIKINFSIMLIIILATNILFAHEGHKKKKVVPKMDTLTMVGKDTIAINGIPTKVFFETKHNKTEEEQNKKTAEDEEVKEITFSAAFEHIHNKVIHFPIALTVIGFFLMLLGYKENKYWDSLKIIIPIAAFVTVIAVLSGLNQAEPFEGKSSYSLVETHELLGFGVLASLVFWSASFYIKKLKRFVWVFALITFALVSIAGLYGGVIAH